MMPKKCKYRLTNRHIPYILAIWFFPAQCFGSGFTADELIQKIRASEDQIHDMLMNVVWYEPETKNKLVTFKWGYENGKEFIEGNKWSGEDKEEPTATIRYTFDGEKQGNFRHSTGEKKTTGGVYGLDPTTFSVYGTPKVLLGYSIKQNAKETFGEILSGAEEINIKGSDDIEGRPCLAVEVSGVKDGANIFDFRVWIDTERGFRPLKIDGYMRPENQEKWKLLSQRIDNINLKEIDGIWFPVSGENQSFRRDGTPMCPKRRIDIDESSIRINKGISPDMFKINFPPGCRVWDDFAQIGYIVGELDNKIEQETLNNDNATEKKNDLIIDKSIGSPYDKMVISSKALESDRTEKKDFSERKTNLTTNNRSLLITIICLAGLLVAGFSFICFLYVKRKV